MTRLAHAAFEPPGEGPHPTLLALHGFGSNALEVLGLGPQLAGGRLLVIAPQGPEPVALGPPGTDAPVGYGWFPLQLSRLPTPLSVAQGVATVRGFLVDAFDRYPIDRARVAVLGFSQGGVVAYGLALPEPERFRALLALSSWLPDDLARAMPEVDRGRLEVWVQHGVRDEVVAVTRGRSSAERLRRFGAQVTYREYDMGHEMSARSVAELSAWLEARLL